MVIWEVRCYGGEYENAFDDHIAAYMTQEAAEEKKAQLIQEEFFARKQRDYCCNCPLAFETFKDMEHFKAFQKEHEHYASCVKEAIAEEYERGIFCTCYDYGDDDVDYYIQRIEVIEK